MTQNLANSVHFVLHSHGGIGKSVICTYLAQYLQEKGDTPLCVDTDSVHQTLSQYKALNVYLCPVIQQGKINPREFDALLDKIITSQNRIIVDIATALFFPFLDYMKIHDGIILLQDRPIFIHTIITGGSREKDSIACLSILDKWLTGTVAKLIVWQNEYWGVPNQKEPLSSNHSENIVRLSRRQSDTFDQVLNTLTKSHLTYQEAATSGEFQVLFLSRAYQIFQEIFHELDKLFNKESSHA